MCKRRIAVEPGTRLDVAHCSEVIDFGRADIRDDCNEIGGITKITVVKEKLDFRQKLEGFIVFLTTVKLLIRNRIVIPRSHYYYKFRNE